MEFTIISRNDLAIRATISATPDEVDEAIHDMVRAIMPNVGGTYDEGKSGLENLQTVIPADKAPDILRTMVAESLIPRALTQEGLMSVSRPRTVEGSAIPQEGQPFEFETTFFERGEYELTSYEPVTVHVLPPEPVTEEEIDQQLAMLMCVQQGTDVADLSQLTDEWVVANLHESDITTVAQLREAVREAGVQVKAQVAEQEKRSAIVRAYGQRLDGELPADLIAAFAQELTESTEAEARQQGLTLEEVCAQRGVTPEEFAQITLRDAGTMLYGMFAFDAIYRHEGLKAQRDDLLAQAAQAMPALKPMEALQAIEEAGQMYLLQMGAEREVAGRWANEHAHVIYQVQ